MKKRSYRKVLVGDFETTVYKGQTFTEVWASALVELNTEDVVILHSIDDTFSYLKALDCHTIVYYHNLKFDGNFWLYFLISKGFKQAYTQNSDNVLDCSWLHEKDMINNTFKYSISDRGQWYTIIIKVDNHLIEIRDSLKLLPFSVEEIGKSFATKHKKHSMEYEGKRYAGCEITSLEKEYIANDVLVVKEALEIMFSEGHESLTIGACCLDEFKKSLLFSDDYERLFPDLTALEIDESFGSKNVDAYIRHSYKGGWCYLVKGKENKIYKNGITADVNSLYPSMMHSESGNRYPVGLPKFWKGNILPDEALKNNRYFFIRIKTRFYIKHNKLPFIQIKGSHLYKGTEMLTTSDIYDYKTETFQRYYTDVHGNEKDSFVILTLTMTDYYLMIEHYELVDFEILDGCYFNTEVGIFDSYIDKYKKIKMESKGAKRTEAKLFLNNLYGKLASSTDSSFKIAFMKEDNTIGFYSVEEHNKKVGFIAVGSAITSYARNFTIRHAQANYYGVDRAGFIYADTDSIHCDIPANKIKKVKVDANAFCCWKLESSWDKAIFARQKTYIEHVTHEDLEKIEKPFYSIKCAGMPKRCKKLFEMSIEDYKPEENEKFTEEEIEFLSKKRSLEDFKIGLKVPSKLIPKRIIGGVLLIDTTFEMR